MRGGARFMERFMMLRWRGWGGGGGWGFPGGGGVLRGEAVMAFPRWVEELPEGTAEVVSTDFSPFRAAAPGFLKVTEQRVLAGAIGLLAHGRMVAGETGDPAGLDANYVRRSDAEL